MATEPDAKNLNPEDFRVIYQTLTRDNDAQCKLTVTAKASEHAFVPHMPSKCSFTVLCESEFRAQETKAMIDFLLKAWREDRTVTAKVMQDLQKEESAFEKGRQAGLLEAIREVSEWIAMINAEKDALPHLTDGWIRMLGNVESSLQKQRGEVREDPIYEKISARYAVCRGLLLCLLEMNIPANIHQYVTIGLNRVDRI